MVKLRLHRFLPHTRAEGPGVRACVWVQGCPIHCRGCAVPWTWDASGGYDIEVEALTEQVLSSPGIQGVTFLGGEPFSQAAALAIVAERVRNAGLSVMTFSGYTLEHLRRANREDWNALLSLTDLLIDGPFKEELLDTSRPWVGSSNQRYNFFTERYAHLADKLTEIPNRLEIRLTAEGKVELNGLATQADIDRLLKKLVV